MWEGFTHSDTCPQCASTVVDRRATYCSRTCRSRASYARRAAAISTRQATARAAAREAIQKTCPMCGTSFRPERTAKQVHCSPACASRARRDSATRQCRESDCDRPVRAREMCNMHLRRTYRAEGIEASPAWTDRRRENYQRRRALKAGVDAERIVNREIFERDGWSCGLCSEPVDTEIAWPDPRSPSLDHIVPLSRGGSHTAANVQLAHLGCNVEKGDRMLAIP